MLNIAFQNDKSNKNRLRKIVPARICSKKALKEGNAL
jgi:hypothetical protein